MHPAFFRGSSDNFLFFLFLQVFQRHAHRLDHEGGEGAVLSHDGVFHLLDHIVGKADGLIGSCRHTRYFKLAHNTPLTISLVKVYYHMHDSYILRLLHVCATLIVR